MENHLDWDDNTELDITGYNVYRSLTPGGPYAKINSGLVASSAWTDTGLTAGVTYYYAVTAVDISAYESNYSAESSAAPTDQPPTAPSGLAATSGDMQVVLDWADNPQSDLSCYNVYRSLTASANFTLLAGSPSAASAWTDADVSAGTTYYYRVTAVDNSSQESGFSNEVNATPTNDPPSAPVNLTGIGGDAIVTLDWEDNKPRETWQATASTAV
jgi:fibronectin type 3 domain-containing protein